MKADSTRKQLLCNRLQDWKPFVQLWGLRALWVTPRSAGGGSQGQRGSRRALSWRQHLSWRYSCPRESPGVSFTELLPAPQQRQNSYALLGKSTKNPGKTRQLIVLPDRTGSSLQPSRQLITRRNGKAHLTNANLCAGWSWVIPGPRKIQVNGKSPSGTAEWKNISRENPVYLLLGCFWTWCPKLGTMENWPFVYSGPSPRAPHRSALSSKACADDACLITAPQASVVTPASPASAPRSSNPPW